MAKFYKYRELGVSPSQTYRRTKDIFVNSRLFMAQYSAMNDPMEAFYDGNGLTSDEIRSIKQDKTKVRICSLSKTYSDVLMWAHYGGAHKGLCIEVEINDGNVIETEVKYGNQLWTPGCNYSTIVEDIMSHKLAPWQYEDEVRFLRKLRIGDTDPQYLEVHITKVYLGCAIDNSEVQKYSDRINYWLHKKQCFNVSICQLQQDELSYWNGQERIALL